MSVMGMVKPVNMTIPRMSTVAGARACSRVRDNEAIQRKSIDMDKVVTKLNRRKKK